MFAIMIDDNWLGKNEKHELMDDLNLRKAIHMSFETAFIVAHQYAMAPAYKESTIAIYEIGTDNAAYISLVVAAGYKNSPRKIDG